jgi:hypothetical protein
VSVKIAGTNDSIIGIGNFVDEEGGNHECEECEEREECEECEYCSSGRQGSSG